MLVYRLEKIISVGLSEMSMGPWVAACYQRDLEEVTWRYKRKLPGHCPEPEADGISGYMPHSEHVCGWYNEAGIMNWCRWRDDTEALQAVGFKINVYDVPDDKVMLGETQCVWSRPDATFLKSVDWQEMVDEILASELERLGIK